MIASSVFSLASSSSCWAALSGDGGGSRCYCFFFTLPFVNKHKIIKLALAEDTRNNSFDEVVKWMNNRWYFTYNHFIRFIYIWNKYVYSRNNNYRTHTRQNSFFLFLSFNLLFIQCFEIFAFHLINRSVNVKQVKFI